MEDQDSDALIRRRLSAVTPGQWNAIAAACIGLGKGNTFGSWGGGEQTESGAIHMSYSIDGPEIRAARDAMADAELFVPYDWTSWSRGREISSKPELWQSMTPEDGVKMWIAQIRAARFNEGSLLAAAESGLLAAALAAVLGARPAG